MHLRLFFELKESRLASAMKEGSPLTSGTMRMRQYLLPVLREVFGHTHQPLDIYSGGEVVAKGAAHVIVSNSRSYGGPFQIARHASLFDGKMDAVIFLRSSRFALFRYLWAALRGRVIRADGADARLAGPAFARGDARYIVPLHAERVDITLARAVADATATGQPVLLCPALDHCAGQGEEFYRMAQSAPAPPKRLPGVVVLVVGQRYSRAIM